jgi:hypothetical protein
MDRTNILVKPAAFILYPEDGGSRFFLILVFMYQTTQHHTPEDCSLDDILIFSCIGNCIKFPNQGKFLILSVTIYKYIIYIYILNIKNLFM